MVNISIRFLGIFSKSKSLEIFSGYFIIFKNILLGSYIGYLYILLFSEIGNWINKDLVWEVWYLPIYSSFGISIYSPFLNNYNQIHEILFFFECPHYNYIIYIFL